MPHQAWHHPPRRGSHEEWSACHERALHLLQHLHHQNPVPEIQMAPHGTVIFLLLAQQLVVERWPLVHAHPECHHE